MRTIAIVGSHSRAQKSFDFDRPDAPPVWCFNAMASKRDTWIKRCDGVFQMHPPAIYKSPNNREDPYHWRWLQKQHDFPIYMLAADPLVPSSVKYPIDEICAKFLSGWTVNGALMRYFSSTIDYALALAIYQGYERIELHGIVMGSNTEYTYQRVGVAFWEGLALGQGIIVDHYSGEQIYDRPLYGYEGNLEHDIEALAVRVDEHNRDRKRAQGLVYQAEMQLDDVWKDGENLPKAIAYLRECRKWLGYFNAAQAEIERYLFKARKAQEHKQPAFIDRNEHETAGFAAQTDCDQHDRLMKESAGRVDVAIKSWINTGQPEALGWLKRFVQEHVKHAENLGAANGILQENLRLMKAADKAITAAGGNKALEYALADAEQLEELQEA